MGRVKKDEGASAAAPAEEPEAPDTPEEDPPAVKTLKEIDDRYLALERQYEQAVMKLQLQYAERQRPIFEGRRKLLTGGDGAAAEAAAGGTPAVERFWLTAMQHHPNLEEMFQEWDEPVLRYLVDIEKAYVDEANTERGFRLTFRFAENPYFSNAELTKEYFSEEVNPWAGEIECKEVKSSKIAWKAGKDVTVGKPEKKVKGGGARKAKQKNKEEPRPSFFREFFRNLKEGQPVSDDMTESMADTGMDEDSILKYCLEQDFEMGVAFRDHIVPFAVRWYTGEAVPEGYRGGGDDEDDDDDDSEEDDDDEEDEDSDDVPAKGKRMAKAKAKASSNKKGAGGTNQTGDNPEQECKQQ